MYLIINIGNFGMAFESRIDSTRKWFKWFWRALRLFCPAEECCFLVINSESSDKDVGDGDGKNDHNHSVTHDLYYILFFFAFVVVAADEDEQHARNYLRNQSNR